MLLPGPACANHHGHFMPLGRRSETVWRALVPHQESRQAYWVPLTLKLCPQHGRTLVPSLLPLSWQTQLFWALRENSAWPHSLRNCRRPLSRKPRSGLGISSESEATCVCSEKSERSVPPFIVSAASFCQTSCYSGRVLSKCLFSSKSDSQKVHRRFNPVGGNYV